VRPKLSYCIMGFFMTFMSLACSTTKYAWKSEPQHQRLSNADFDAEITPLCDQEGCQSFQLSVWNKTDHKIEIDWTHTIYITDGVKAGGFMVQGASFQRRNRPEPPDVIPPHFSRSHTIWPSTLAYSARGQIGGWKHGIMSRGENGVYLSLKVSEKEVGERLTVMLSVVELPE